MIVPLAPGAPEAAAPHITALRPIKDFARVVAPPGHIFRDVVVPHHTPDIAIVLAVGAVPPNDAAGAVMRPAQGHQKLSAIARVNALDHPPLASQPQGPPALGVNEHLSVTQGPHRNGLCLRAVQGRGRFDDGTTPRVRPIKQAEGLARSSHGPEVAHTKRGGLGQTIAPPCRRGIVRTGGLRPGEGRGQEGGEHQRGPH